MLPATAAPIGSTIQSVMSRVGLTVPLGNLIVAHASPARSAVPRVVPELRIRGVWSAGPITTGTLPRAPAQAVARAVFPRLLETDVP